jgi:LacI family kdg operon repressor
MGLKVPEDIALVAFDDLPHALTITPFLTVIAQPGYQMGKKAAELLLDRLNSSTVNSFKELILPCELIVRVSSGRSLPVQDAM